MGIKDFSKAYNYDRIITPKNMKNKKIAIDAMTELFRSALGAKQTNVLTDSDGNPTIHITVILANVLLFAKNSTDQIWVFDHDQNPDEDFHNPAKLTEIIKRKKRKELAKQKLKYIYDAVEPEPLFSDEDEFNQNTQVTQNQNTQVTQNQDTQVTQNQDTQVTQNQDTQVNVLSDEIKTKIQSLEKQTFTVTKEMINDVKLILNFLHVRYINAPKGYEGEAIASYLNEINAVDAVYSADTDPIAYGANTLWRKNARDKKIYEYTISSILQQIQSGSETKTPTYDDFLKSAVILGTDVCAKTPKIGPKTVITKMSKIVLTDEQEKAIKEFKKRPKKTDIVIHNNDKTPFVDCNLEGLIDWLVSEKSFSKSRLVAQLVKIPSLENTYKMLLSSDK